MTAEPVDENIAVQELIPAASKTRIISPTPSQRNNFLFLEKNYLTLSAAFSRAFLPVFLVAVAAV